MFYHTKCSLHSRRVTLRGRFASMAWSDWSRLSTSHVNSVLGPVCDVCGWDLVIDLLVFSSSVEW